MRKRPARAHGKPQDAGSATRAAARAEAGQDNAHGRGAGRFVARHGAALSWGMVAAFVATYTYVAWVKFRYYLFNEFDLAIFAQATGQVFSGSLFSSIRGLNWLGDHSSLILFPIAPLYRLAPHPLTLLVLQSAALGLGALAVHRLARHARLGEAAALSFAALYLLFPAVGYANLFEFHPETLATTPLLFAFVRVRERRPWPAAAFASLALLCKEDVALVVAALGIYALWAHRRQGLRLAVVLWGLAAASALFSAVVAKPLAGPGLVDYGGLYEQWGPDLGTALSRMIGDPVRLIGAFFSTPGDLADTAAKREYWLHLLLPLGFLPLLSPAALLVAWPAVAEHLLSWRIQQHTIVYHYTALVTPFAVSAAVLGFANLMRWVERIGSGVRRHAGEAAGRGETAWTWTIPILAASIAAQVMFGPFSSGPMLQTVRRPQPIRPSPHVRALAAHRDRMVARVPEGGVVAGFEFLPRFAGRRQVHSAHHLVSGLYTFSSMRYPVPAGIAAFLADPSAESLIPNVGPETAPRLRALVRKNELAPVDVADGLLLFVRGATDSLSLLSRAASQAVAPPLVFDRALALLGGSCPNGVVRGGERLRVLVEWQRVGRLDRVYTVEFQLWDARGRRVHAVSRLLGYGLWPPAEWPAGDAIREESRIVVPSGLEPGTYSLALRVGWRSGMEVGDAEPNDPALRARGGVLPLARIEVRPGTG